jgi:hypothetical protein
MAALIDKMPAKVQKLCLAGIVNDRYCRFRIGDGHAAEAPMTTHFATLMRKLAEDPLFRRVCTGNATFYEMVAEAILNDCNGAAYELAPHNARSIDLVASNGKHVQVKMIGAKSGFAAIYAGRDAASEVMIITIYEDRHRYFFMPMAVFKALGGKYDRKGRSIPEDQTPEMWTIGPVQIRRGVLDEFEIFPA